MEILLTTLSFTLLLEKSINSGLRKEEMGLINTEDLERLSKLWLQVGEVIFISLVVFGVCHMFHTFLQLLLAKFMETLFHSMISLEPSLVDKRYDSQNLEFCMMGNLSTELRLYTLQMVMLSLEEYITAH